MLRPSLLLLLSTLLLPACRPEGVPGLPPPLGEEDPDFRLPGLHAELDPVAGGRIVDSHGREVLLRGVNVNAFVEYWAYAPELPTTTPFDASEADRIAFMGWNVVRLLLSWSRVEPEPGHYDESYLDEIEGWVRQLDRGGDTAGRRVYIYEVRNARAEKMAAVLNEVFASQAEREAPPAPSLAPGLQPASIGSPQETPAQAAAAGAAAAAPPPAGILRANCLES